MELNVDQKFKLEVMTVHYEPIVLQNDLTSISVKLSMWMLNPGQKIIFEITASHSYLYNQLNYRKQNTIVD